MTKEEFIAHMDSCLKRLIVSEGTAASCGLIGMIGEVIRNKYGAFIESCFEGFSSGRRLENYLCNVNYMRIDKQEAEVVYFIRSLLLLQFKEHCLETKLYEQF